MLAGWLETKMRLLLLLLKANSALSCADPVPVDVCEVRIRVSIACCVRKHLPNRHIGSSIHISALLHRCGGRSLCRRLASRNFVNPRRRSVIEGRSFVNATRAPGLSPPPHVIGVSAAPFGRLTGCRPWLSFKSPWMVCRPRVFWSSLINGHMGHSV